jgi:hypothetical protein
MGARAGSSRGERPHGGHEASFNARAFPWYRRDP